MTDYPWSTNKLLPSKGIRVVEAHPDNHALYIPISVRVPSTLGADFFSNLAVLNILVGHFLYPL